MEAGYKNSVELNHFKKTHPCPSNGNAKGPCPGYIVDHIKPLECGGLDDPSNMQWQTVQEAKIKDKLENTCCKRGLTNATIK